MRGQSFIDKLKGQVIEKCRIIDYLEKKPVEMEGKNISPTYQYLYLKTVSGLEMFFGGGVSWENETKIVDMSGKPENLIGKTIDYVEFILNNDVIDLGDISRIETDETLEYYDDCFNESSYMKVQCTDGYKLEVLFRQAGWITPESSEAAWRIFKDNERIEVSHNFDKEINFDY